MNLNDDIARQLIRERVEARATTRRPSRRLDPTD